MLAALILAPMLVTTVVDVSIEGFAFVPDSVSVKQGDTVRWTNKDNAAHTSTGTGAGFGAWASGSMAKNATYLRVFNTVGPFNYKCDFHTSMTAKVVTTAATSIRPSTVSQHAAGTDAAQLRDARGRSLESTEKQGKRGNAVPAFRKPNQ